MKIVDVITNNKMASSKSEARRLIAQGAVHLNGRKISSIEEEIEPGTLQVGKRKKTLIIRKREKERCCL